MINTSLQRPDGFTSLNKQNRRQLKDVRIVLAELNINLPKLIIEMITDYQKYPELSVSKRLEAALKLMEFAYAKVNKLNIEVVDPLKQQLDSMPTEELIKLYEERRKQAREVIDVTASGSNQNRVCQPSVEPGSIGTTTGQAQRGPGNGEVQDGGAKQEIKTNQP